MGISWQGQPKMDSRKDLIVSIFQLLVHLYECFLCFFYIEFDQSRLHLSFTMQPEEDQARNAKIINMLEPIDRKIYSLIKQAPCIKKDLNRKTNLPSAQIDKILHQLQQYSLIKAVKKPQTKNQNVWVLYHQKQQDYAQQAKHQTQQITDFIITKLRESSLTVAQLNKQINRKGLNNQNLQQVLQVMKIRCDIWVQGETIRLRQIKTINAPCIECPLSKICKIGGTVSPERCPYMAQW